MRQKNALEYALLLLGYRARSEKEMRERLIRKGYSGPETAKAMKSLSQMGCLNDRELALALARQARETKRLGRKGAAAYLFRMGIPGGFAEEALAEYDECEGAKNLVRKKLKTLGGLPEDVRRRRLYGALARRGFSGQTIRKTIALHREEEEE